MRQGPGSGPSDGERRLPRLRVGVDIGGTFTDFVVFDEAAQELRSFKLPSTPDDPSAAVLDGLREVAAGPGPRGSPPSSDVEPEEAGDPRLCVVHGSTVATNAVLERSGPRTAFLTTGGFRDLLRIGRQARPALYDWFADPPPPLVPPELCFEVRERVGRGGELLEPLAPAELERVAARIAEAGAESVAVSFLFSFLRPEHERRAAERLRQAGLHVSPSSEVLPEFREYERASTTVLNAYVTPVLDRYLSRIQRERPACELRVMLSNGGSADAGEARRLGVRSILSGPAAGTVGALHVARAAGFESAITFDMGGTSTDVSLARGELRLTTEGEIGGLPLRVPIVDLHTVGSGGGSIARVDPGGVLRVGPRSAGSEPGPACYGRGGSAPTVTDANLLLGRLPDDGFLGGRWPLDREAARVALERLAADAALRSEDGLSAARVAALGVLRVADAHMERALRVISVERGYDPADFLLVSFGGAGGLHACGLARRLGVPRVLIPPGASTLSAYGMLAAPVVRDAVRTVMLPGTTPYEEVQRRAQPLAEKVREEVLRDGVPAAEVVLHPQAELRYAGQSYELRVDLEKAYVERFHEAHRRAYGYAAPERPVEVVNLRVRASGPVEAPPLPSAAVGPSDARAALLDRRPVVVESGGSPGGAARRTGRPPGSLGAHLVEVPFYSGDRLAAGTRLAGPAVVLQPDTTAYLPPGAEAALDPRGNLLISIDVSA
ncbi:MAG: hydantoinase/oxoprolinase family protein [Gemmatimonadota bacterium]